MPDVRSLRPAGGGATAASAASAAAVAAVTAVLVATAFAATPTAAQEPFLFEAEPAPSHRSGLWVGGGLGGASSLVSCAICNEQRESGIAGHARAGATLSPTLLAGAELDAWWHKRDEITQLVTSIALAAFLYPQPRSGFHLKAGVAGLRYSRADDEDNAARTTTYGLLLGLGYDIPVGPSTSLSPYLNAVATSFGTLRDEENGVIISDVNVTMVQLGVGITLH